MYRLRFREWKSIKGNLEDIEYTVYVSKYRILFYKTIYLLWEESAKADKLKHKSIYVEYASRNTEYFFNKTNYLLQQMSTKAE